MNILFLHRSFPGQFKFLALALACDPNNTVVFISEEEEDAAPLEGINNFVYKLDKKTNQNCHPYLESYQVAIAHGEATASVALALKNEGFRPDIIFGFSSWGSSLFMKDVYPDVPVINYFEWFCKPNGADLDFDGTIFNEDDKARIRCSSSHLYLDLVSCDAGITPTEWQKYQFPKEFQDKIRVIHEGIDTELCKPNAAAKFIIPGKNIELTIDDEIITYGTRGMEPYRGFPQFMEAVEKLLKKRPNAHFVIPGNDAVYYSNTEESKTYKELMLEKFDIDLNRVHFVGELPLVEYIKLLQISSAHVYLTYPFVLSWSILNAMSTECCVIASDTQPVLEVIKDNYNGLLVDFYNVDQLVDRIEYAIENKIEMQTIRKNARQTVLDKYAFENCLVQQIKFMYEVIEKNSNLTVTVN